MKKEKLEQWAKAKKVKQSPWYKVAGDTLLGVDEGAWKAVVDIFKGIFDLAVALATDPEGFLEELRMPSPIRFILFNICGMELRQPGNGMWLKKMHGVAGNFSPTPLFRFSA